MYVCVWEKKSVCMCVCEHMVYVCVYASTHFIWVSVRVCVSCVCACGHVCHAFAVHTCVHIYVHVSMLPSWSHHKCSTGFIWREGNFILWSENHSAFNLGRRIESKTPSYSLPLFAEKDFKNNIIKLCQDIYQQRKKAAEIQAMHSLTPCCVVMQWATHLQITLHFSRIIYFICHKLCHNSYL